MLCKILCHKGVKIYFYTENHGKEISTGKYYLLEYCAFNINLITDSDSADFSKEFDLFEFLCLAFVIEIFTASGTEHGKNHFFAPKLHHNLTS